MTNTGQLRRIRWAVRAVGGLGIAASVTANVLHAQDNPISQAIAAWPPIALVLTVELISRVPVHSRKMAWVRRAATAIIAGIAAWVSYWHMAGVASRYGETGASPYLLPFSVDGLVVVSFICLLELGMAIARAAEVPAQQPTQPVEDPQPDNTPERVTPVEHPTPDRPAQPAEKPPAALTARTAPVVPIRPRTPAVRQPRPSRDDVPTGPPYARDELGRIIGSKRMPARVVNGHVLVGDELKGYGRDLIEQWLDAGENRNGLGARVARAVGDPPMSDKWGQDLVAQVMAERAEAPEPVRAPAGLADARQLELVGMVGPVPLERSALNGDTHL